MLSGTLDLLRGLAAARFVPAFAKRIADWANRADRVAKRRNFVVHSPWMGYDIPEGAPDNAMFEKLSMRAMRNRIGTISLKELRALRDESLQLTVEGTDLWFEIADAVDPQPKR
jgi:hypothetical protein